MPFVGHDPERLRRVARGLRYLSDELRFAALGAPGSVTAGLRRISDDCDHAAARVVTTIRLMDTALVRVSTARLASVVSGDDMWWFDAVRRPITQVDVLLRSGRTGIIDSIDDDAVIAALVFGTVDTESVRRFWLTATDPERVGPALARDRVLKLLRAVVHRDWQTYVTGHGVTTSEHWRVDHEATLLAAEVAGAWQIRLTGLAHDWDVDAAEGRDLLIALCSEADAASLIAAGLAGAVWRELSDPPADTVGRRRLIDDVAFGVGASTEILRASEVDRARADDAVLDAVLHLPQLAPLGIPWAATTVLGLGADLLGDALAHADVEARRAALGEVARRDLLAAVAVGALWRAAVTDGRASPRSRAVPHDVALELQHARDSVSNQAGRGDAFAAG